MYIDIAFCHSCLREGRLHSFESHLLEFSWPVYEYGPERPAWALREEVIWKHYPVHYRKPEVLGKHQLQVVGASSCQEIGMKLGLPLFEEMQGDDQELPSYLFRSSW